MLKETKDGLIAHIKISPNSKKNEIINEGDFTKLKLQPSQLMERRIKP